MLACHPRGRGQSTVVGVALLLAIVFAVMGAVVVIGANATDDTAGELDERRAEKLLTQFDSKSAMVALGDTDSQGVDLPSDGTGAFGVRDDAGWMNVTLINRTDDSRRGLMNVTMGSLVYEGENAELAYQGGGVWKHEDDGATMVSPPEFHYRNATLTLPAILVRGQGSLGSMAAITHNRTTRQFPNTSADPDWRNPLVRRKVNVTVHSDYYDAWGRYFERRTDGDVAVDHENGTATLTLVTPPSERQVENAVAATSNVGEIRVSGNGARTDSYNSTNGNYSQTASEEGTVTTAGEVYVGGDGEVQGSIRSGKSVQVTGSGYVEGDVAYTTGEKIKESNVDGTVTRIDGVGSEDPISSYIEIRNESFRSDNDNADTSLIDGTDFEMASDSATLSAGRYHVENLTLSDERTLTMDPSDTNVSILVEDYVRVEDNSTLNVTDSEGRVNIYVEGKESDPVTKADFTIRKSGGNVSVPDENATRLWVYGKRDFEARIEGSSSVQQRFVGVFYAPGGPSGTSSVYVKHGNVYGGAVASTVRLDQGGTVHFDRALMGATVLPDDLDLVRITYLHVTANRVQVDDD